MTWRDAVPGDAAGNVLRPELVAASKGYVTLEAGLVQATELMGQMVGRVHLAPTTTAALCRCCNVYPHKVLAAATW